MVSIPPTIGRLGVLGWLRVIGWEDCFFPSHTSIRTNMTCVLTYFRLFSTTYLVCTYTVYGMCRHRSATKWNKHATAQNSGLPFDQGRMMTYFVAKCTSCCCSCLHIKEARRAFCFSGLVFFLIIKTIYIFKIFFSADATRSMSIICTRYIYIYIIYVHSRGRKHAFRKTAYFVHTYQTELVYLKSVFFFFCHSG